MFIYEKNKLNKETGQVEQSLNVTFEGNKPVETPDVVITKDGVTGIKSDSNAYAFHWKYNAEPRPNSISVNGEITEFDDSFLEDGTLSIGFTKTVGFNITQTPSGNTEYLTFFGVLSNGDKVFEEKIKSGEELLDIRSVGEYIIDMDNKIVHTPYGDFDISATINKFRVIFGIKVGYFGG